MINLVAIGYTLQATLRNCLSSSYLSLLQVDFTSLCNVFCCPWLTVIHWSVNHSDYFFCDGLVCLSAKCFAVIPRVFWLHTTDCLVCTMNLRQMSDVLAYLW